MTTLYSKGKMDLLKITGIILFIFSVLIIPATHAHSITKISLEVDIDTDRSQLNGIAKMDVSARKEIALAIGALKIKRITSNGRPVAYDESGGIIKILPLEDGQLEIRYTGIFKDRALAHNSENPGVQNVIDNRGVSLTNIWYPSPGALCHYDLKATLPSSYTVISEAEDVQETRRNGKTEHHFNFPYQTDGINLVASDRYVIVKDEFRGIKLYAYFFPEDKKLAETYMEFTKKYLALYEDLLGKYPFKRFSIVENFLPTGYSMPTYTLLGSEVVKLPFIVETSLGHEILHQWFGNSVYIDHDSGNWAEGLTTYLADHLYSEQKSDGWNYRKQTLIDYKSYVDEGNDIPLKHFTGRIDRPSRAIGYGKTAMVFHMLKNLVGEKVFYASLKDLIENNQFKKASWNDIKISFEKKYAKDLNWFFTQWIEKKGLPELTLQGVKLSQSGREFRLHFSINQGENIFRLKLPVTIYLKERVLFDILDIGKKENRFDLTFPDKPHKIVLDENYDVARGLNSNELPPVISRLLGEDKIIIAIPAQGEKVYGSLIDEFKRNGAVAKAADDITIADISGNAVIIPGIETPLIQRLYGALDAEDAGFSITMKNNPWNPQKVIAILQANSKEEVDAAYRKIFHYGKYSKLLFNKGVNAGKEIYATDRGMIMNMRSEPSAIEVSSIKTLSDVINGVQDKKIIYVGEIHDVFAHHAVQLDIITGIYKKHPQIAIGMEMFQRPFQKILDRFISGDIGEVEFLKQSEYFKRWGFDYNLYKPILDFAKAEKIPVIALNLQREIIEKVSHAGIDSLSEREKNEIPANLDFSDSTYRQSLKEIFSLHKNADEKNFDYFYQSQILWDETMSNSIAGFMKQNPDRKIIVVAGQGHLRYGSGIPKRTFRRNGEPYAIVLIDEEVEQGIADYVVFPKPVEGITTPMLMVFMKKDGERFKITGFPDQSVSEKAGLKIEDIILYVDDIKITSIDDIKYHLFYKKKGDIVKVRVSRKEAAIEKEMVFDVEL